jgi:hypothetical protein
MFAEIILRSSSKFNPANCKNNRFDGIDQSPVLLPQKQISKLGPRSDQFCKNNTIRSNAGFSQSILKMNLNPVNCYT